MYLAQKYSSTVLNATILVVLFPYFFPLFNVSHHFPKVITFIVAKAMSAFCCGWGCRVEAVDGYC
jgi:hypothetical protein